MDQTSSTSESRQRVDWSELARLREKVRLRFEQARESTREGWQKLEQQLAQLETDVKERGEAWSELSRRRLLELRQRIEAFAAGNLPERVEGVMTRQVATCSASGSLADAAQIMWDQDRGVVPVTDEQGHLLGVITDRDVCMSAYTQGQALRDIPLSVAMSQPVVTCRAGDPLRDVLKRMAQARVHRLPVCEADGTVIGMVSLTDIARAALAISPTGGLYLRDVVTALASIHRPRAETPRA